jgi:hypothetical protein
MKPTRILTFLAVAILALLPRASYSQSSGKPAEFGGKSDSAIIFESPRPLIDKGEGADAAYPNTWGLSAFFSDYGFGGGVYYSRQLSTSFTGMLSLDLGTAKGPKEFGLATELKINRIFVVPFIFSAQYRLFRELLSDNFRPYLTGGAGPVFVITTPAYKEFFSSFGSVTVKPVAGGFLGVGANFGLDKKSTFGANLRYYFIPYPAPGIESTAGVKLTDFNGLFLTVNYGFNF